MIAPTADRPTTEDLLSRADEIEANKTRWAEWLAGLRAQVAEAEAFERRDLPAELKVEFWQRLVDGYTEDDPDSTEDDDLRELARQRLAHWRGAARVPPPPPASLVPDSGGPRAGDLLEDSKTGWVPNDRYILAEIQPVPLAPGEFLEDPQTGWVPNDRYILAEIQPAPLAPGEFLEDPQTGMRLRWIPPGRFQMGSPPGEEGRFDGELLHEVELTRGFWLAETEVTQRQWRALIGNNPSTFSSCGDDCPVETVSWWDAVTFADRLSSEAGLESCYALSGCSGTPGEWGYACREVIFKGSGCRGYRLPTEAEWERAARAGKQTPFWTGESLTTDQANFAGGELKKVGSFTANPWGLHDVHGNVYEWVWDRFGPYSAKLVSDPVGPTDEALRVVRGGAWGSSARGVRAAHRDALVPGYRYGHVGFRLSRGPEQ